MTYNFFLTLVLAVGFISTAPNLLNTGTATWDHPKRVAAHPELYKRTNEGKVYDPAKVISAMGKIDEGLKILTAHRGISGPKCPENSKCSVKATVDAGIESVEIDVYSDKNGNLWPLHDRRIGNASFKYLGAKLN
jgi:glycerophosphoryl diester phosphodiesterase